MREMERLISTLFPEDGPKLVDIKFFPGEQPVTVEEFCAEVNSAFVQVDSGMVTALSGYEETFNTVSVEQFVSAA